MSKLIKFTDRAAALKASADEAAKRGCGRNPEDVTRYWWDDIDDAVFIPDAEPIPKDGVELKGKARSDHEAKRPTLEVRPR